MDANTYLSKSPLARLQARAASVVKDLRARGVARMDLYLLLSDEEAILGVDGRPMSTGEMVYTAGQGLQQLGLGRFLSASSSFLIEPVRECSSVDARTLAERFHDLYEELAPAHGWETQERSRKPFADLPQENRSLMIAVAEGIIKEFHVGRR